MKITTQLSSATLTLLTISAIFSACDSSPTIEHEGTGGDLAGDGDSDIGLAGSSNSGDGDGDSGGDGDSNCGGEDVEAAPLAANVLLMIDSSGSMADGASGFTESKWDTLIDSLGTALPEIEELLSLGLKLYPSGDTHADVCSISSGVEVEVGAGAETVSDISDALAAASPGGDTPTSAALADALEYFTTGAGKDLEGNKFVLLATDGGPNCSDSPAIDCTCDNPVDEPTCGERTQCTVNYDPDNAFCTLDGANGSCCDVQTLCLDDGGTIDAVEALADAGIKTIVLGMPGSEAFTDVLDQLAVSGQLPASTTSPKYNRVDNADALTDAMRAVTRNVIRSCDLQLAETPPHLGRVNVFLDGTVIPQDNDDGWVFDMDTDPPTITITGSTCSDVEEEGVEKITVQYGCQTVVR